MTPPRPRTPLLGGLVALALLGAVAGGPPAAASSATAAAATPAVSPAAADPATDPATAADPAAALAATSVDATMTPLGSPFASAVYDGRGGLNGGITWSSPAVGDVTGDGRPEIVTSGFDGRVRVHDTAGRVVAVGDTGAHAVFGSPALGDVSGDGVLDVTVGNAGNRIMTFSFARGTTSVVLDRTEPARVLPGPTGFFSTPALGHVDGDARLDVIASSWGQTVHAFTAAPGRGGAHVAGWPRWVLDTSWSSPAFGDVDGDGSRDVVVGGDCEGSGELQPCWGTKGGGYVWAFERDGRVKWKTFVPGQVVWSSPTLVDLDRDGAQDVVVGTGLFWADPAGRQMTAYDGRTGRARWSVTMPGRIAGSPSVGDVTGDGRPEVFIVSEGGALAAVSPDGAVLWRSCTSSSGTCRAGMGTFGGVALADVDGDGRVEAMIMGEDTMRVHDGATGRVERTVASPVPYATFAPASPPTVAQVDGQTWVLQTALGDANGNLRRDTGDRMMTLVWRTGQPLGAAPWPTFKGGNLRTSTVPLPAIDRAATHRFVDSLYRDLLGRRADPSGLATWGGAVVDRRMSRYQVATTLASSDEWLDRVVSGFYRDTLGREPDAGGLAYWKGRVRGGTPVATVAASFYASPEYYARTGGTDRAYVTDLYRRLLRREPDAAGLQGWMTRLAGGTSRTAVATQFHSSDEAVARRIDGLYRHLLGRPADPAGLTSWPRFVRSSGDLALAAGLAASQEYYLRAQSRS